MPGGRLNLGRLEEGSGYCVGAVVETRMGVGEDGGMAGNGMRDVWVLGEGFFRGVGGVFDVSLSSSYSFGLFACADGMLTVIFCIQFKDQKVGFRIY